MYNIVFYKDKNGKSEIEDYLLKLQKKKDKDSRIKLNKITAYIDMLLKYGTNMGTPYVKHLDDEIWELRPLRDRILFAYWENNKLILLSIFMKKTQKTPQREIKKAKRYLEDFRKRSGNDGE